MPLQTVQPDAAPDSASSRPSIGALDLEDIAYERVPVRVTILGQRYVWDAWVRGQGCPGRIGAAFERLRVRMVRGLAENNGGAYQEFLTDALRAIFEAPVSELDAIDLLAGDVARAERILIHTKWRTEDVAEDPEATSGGDSTTPPSSPTSSDATAASAPTAAAG